MKIIPLFGQHHVPGQDGRPPDPDGIVDGGQHHLLDVGRVVPFDPGVEPFDLFQPFDIPDGTVKDHAVLRFGVDGIAEVIPDQGAVHDLAVAVGDVHVARRQNVDGPGIGPADPAFRLSFFLDQLIPFRAEGHVLRRHRPADHDLVGTQDHPVAFKGIVVAFIAQNTPGFFEGNIPEAFQQPIRRFGPAVRESFPFPFRGQGDDLFRRRRNLLGCSACKGECEQKKGQ